MAELHHVTSIDSTTRSLCGLTLPTPDYCAGHPARRWARADNLPPKFFCATCVELITVVLLAELPDV